MPEVESIAEGTVSSLGRDSVEKDDCHSPALHADRVWRNPIRGRDGRFISAETHEIRQPGIRVSPEAARNDTKAGGPCHRT